MVPAVSVNYLAVLAAAIAAMALGFLWYGPLFGKMWMKLMNIDKKKIDEAKKKGMAMNYAIMIISTLVMSYTLAHLVKFLEVTNILDALRVAFWMWLGFIATVMIGIVLWEGKSWKLYCLNVTYWLVNLALMSAILTLMP